MKLESSVTDLDTKSEVLGLASWNKERTTEELLSFISRREAQIFAD